MRGSDIRPTSDRLRETLFNVLTAGNPQALDGSVWLDLFAGSGAVGIEALSRGAAMVYFAECSRPAAELIRQNLDRLMITQGFRIVPKEASRAILQLEAEGIRADFAFFDPPYRLKAAYGETLEALESSKLAESALIIAEHEKRFDPGEQFGNLQRSGKLEQGDSALSFYRRV